MHRREKIRTLALRQLKVTVNEMATKKFNFKNTLREEIFVRFGSANYYVIHCASSGYFFSGA